jgi:phospholipid-binding lipoprotein MlaA
MNLLCRLTLPVLFLIASIATPCAAEIPPHRDSGSDLQGRLPLDSPWHSSVGQESAPGTRFAQVILKPDEPFDDESDDFDEFDEEVFPEEIADPLETLNRAFFTFNDRLYFWVLKPVARGYRRVLPEPVRVGIGNFFSNITTPVRVANCLLQTDMRGTGTEVFRFLVNSTVGVAGFRDAGKRYWGVEKRPADLGQTFGFYGLGPGFFITWPVLGPSSLRDSVGTFGDYFLDPLSYASNEVKVGAAGTYRVNETSLTLGQYESLKRAALDPYIAARDVYQQYRTERIQRARERGLIRRPEAPDASSVLPEEIPEEVELPPPPLAPRE